MGSQRLYDYIDNNPLFEFHPTEYVNDPFVIAQHDKMVGHQRRAGDRPHRPGLRRLAGPPVLLRHRRPGGLHPRRGPRRGGKPIIAMPSTAKNDTVSRIVPTLTQGAGVVTTRGDVHYVVTEYGIAYLHGKSIRERALALINIAHPKFRHELIQAAKASKYIYEDQIEMAWDKVRYPEELERYRDAAATARRSSSGPVKPTDEPALAEMLYSLSAESVRSGSSPTPWPSRTRTCSSSPTSTTSRTWPSSASCPGRRRGGDRRHRPVFPRPQDAVGRSGVHRAGRVAAEGHGHVPAEVPGGDRHAARRQAFRRQGAAREQGHAGGVPEQGLPVRRSSTARPTA